MGKIVEGEYISVWDGGMEICSPCKINTETKEVFDIEPGSMDADALNNLEDEFVQINGERFEVSRDSGDGTDYWYK